MIGYQKIINLLDNPPNQPSTFRTRYWVKANYDARGTYNTNSQIKFKSKMFTVPNMSEAQEAANIVNKKVIFKNCASFTDCIGEITNAQVDNAKDIYVVMPI